VPRPDQVPWANRRSLSRHFHDHGSELRRATIGEYETSSRGTIRAGTRFTFRDRLTHERRVGYFDRRNDRLTVLDEAETYIVTHFRCDEDYVRGCNESDYVRHG